MWGNIEAATPLTQSDPLAAVLFQITGPAHIPVQDPRWQELLTGYDVWVHIEFQPGTAAEDDVLHHACSSLRQHATRTSNMAAFAMHLTRMLRDMNDTNDGKGEHATNATNERNATNGSNFQQRIARVAKARAVAGLMHLFRILLHSLLLTSNSNHVSLADVFMYQSRESHVRPKDTAAELVTALLHWTSDVGTDTTALTTTPELYDAAVAAMELWLVMLATEQLYKPFQSSFERTQSATPQQAPTTTTTSTITPFFWDILFRNMDTIMAMHLTQACLHTWLQRPKPPPRSIAHHNISMVQSLVVAAAHPQKPGPDGMYESHLIAQSASPDPTNTNSTTLQPSNQPQHHSALFDATKGVLVLSSTIILLPFRLVRLAIELFSAGKKHHEDAQRKHVQQQIRTKDTIWLTESPLSDLAASLLLLLLNNERNRGTHHYIRTLLTGMTDTRWEGDGGLLPDLPGRESEPLLTTVAPVGKSISPTTNNNNRNDQLQVNFEALFESFGKTAHNELGALMLYTILQASPSFSESIAVRSDLDTIVLPLLRTFYLSSSLKHYAAQDFSARVDTKATGVISIRNCPFRSQSQLYVIVILLLLFSQDPSFGPDAFRRVTISQLVWYKERNLKDISLGSVLVLCTLRMLTFNLNRLRDSFLLSNCCAVLMNLSVTMVDLHDYCAMRLASVTTATMKKYAQLYEEDPSGENEPSSAVALHGEVARTLLRIIKQCLGTKTIQHNLHLIYALVYHQTDFKRIVNKKDTPFKKSETSRILKVIESASSIIDEKGDARTAPKALKALAEEIERIQAIVTERRKNVDLEETLFTYEEEADPEIFFVPYVWEVIVSVVTSTSIEWDKNRIQVFELLDEEPIVLLDDTEPLNPSYGEYSKDVSDVV